MIVEKHYSPKELAELVRVNEGTLAQWRYRSKKEPHAPARGPRFVHIGRLVRYPAASVHEWLAQRQHVAASAK